MQVNTGINKKVRVLKMPVRKDLNVSILLRHAKLSIMLFIFNPGSANCLCWGMFRYIYIKLFFY